MSSAGSNIEAKTGTVVIIGVFSDSESDSVA